MLPQVQGRRGYKVWCVVTIFTLVGLLQLFVLLGRLPVTIVFSFHAGEHTSTELTDFYYGAAPPYLWNFVVHSISGTLYTCSINCNIDAVIHFQ